MIRISILRLKHTPNRVRHTNPRQLTINDKNLNSEIETYKGKAIKWIKRETINDKNLNSEIETLIMLAAWTRLRNTSINDKNLNSEIETEIFMRNRLWGFDP